MAVNEMNFGSVFQKFRFFDSDGDLIGKCRINPADPKLVHRCEEVSEYFGEKKGEPKNAAELAALNDEIEEKICYLLGYDAKDELFGMLPACSVLPDGELFVGKVMEKIMEYLEPEIKKRKENMQAAISKHTAKYAK